MTPDVVGQPTCAERSGSDLLNPTSEVAENAARLVQDIAEKLPKQFLQDFFAGTSLAMQGDPFGRSSAVRAIPPLAARERLYARQREWNLSGGSSLDTVPRAGQCCKLNLDAVFLVPPQLGGDGKWRGG